MEENKVGVQEIETSVVKPKMSLFVNSVENRLLSTEDESKLDKLLSDVSEFMGKNSGKGKTEEEKDNLYLSAQTIWHEYADMLRNVKFSLYLNRKQYNFLTSMLLTKMEYNVDSVFVALEVSNTLLSWQKESSKYKNDEEVFGFLGNPTEVTYIYHLISKYTVKGIVNDTYRFAEVLTRIADVSRIINYYDTMAKNLASEITDWVSSFEEGVQVENKKPKKQSKEVAE